MDDLTGKTHIVGPPSHTLLAGAKYDSMSSLKMPSNPQRSGVKVKTSLRKSVAAQLRVLFDVRANETLPAEHVNEALMFLFEEMRARPDFKARFWQHMSDAKRRREQVHVNPAAKRQRRYRERQKEKLRKEMERKELLEEQSMQQQLDLLQAKNV